MTTSFSPADMPQRRPPEIGPVTEGHAPKIRAFAFFPYRGDRGAVDPGDLAKVAWRDVLTALADMAEPEEWTGPNPTGRTLPILDSFLRLSVGAPRTGGRLLYGSDVSLGCCLVRVLSVGLASSRASSQALVRAQRCARPVGVKRRRSLAVRREIS